MARVNTNNFGLRYVIESSLGVAPTTGWKQLEPNDITTFGPSITTVERRPISSQRGERKGTVVNLESEVGFEADLTMDAFTDFAEGFVFSQFANDEFVLRESAAPPSVDGTPTGYTVDSVTAQLAAKLTYDVGGTASLLYGLGYALAANNGLKPLTAAVSATDTELTVSGLATETPPASADLQVAGVRVAIGDLALTVSGSTATIVSSADISDWSALGLQVGQFIHVGSDDGTGAVQNAFDDGSGGDVFGYARITAISGGTLTLDKLDVNLDTTDAANATAVDIMFGRFLRNVAVGASAVDGEYLERSFQFEGEYPDLEGVGSDAYEYPEGNFANEWVLNLPLNDKATANWSFIGTTTDEVTATRKTGPSSAVDPLRTTAVNTSSDIAVISTDVVSSQSDVCFQDLTVTINNNVSPQNCLGTLGASFINTGLFQVTMDGTMLFTRKEITNAIRNNTTVTFHTILKNDNGAIAVDMPSLTLGDGQKSFPLDEAVQVTISGRAFADPTGTIPNVSLGVSLFATVPTIRPAA